MLTFQADHSRESRPVTYVLSAVVTFEPLRLWMYWALGLTSLQINYRMRVTLNDGRQMTGQMLAFDKVAQQKANTWASKSIR